MSQEGESERGITPVKRPATPEKQDDITGSIFELEQDEISTPKGPKRSLPKAPSFPRNPEWIAPETLIEEIWKKKKPLKLAVDDASAFIFPSADEVLEAHYWQVNKK